MTKDEVLIILKQIAEQIMGESLPEDFDEFEALDDYVGDDLNSFELAVEKKFHFSHEDFMELVETGGSFDEAADYIIEHTKEGEEGE